MAKNTICLWYDHDAQEAANFYARTFPDSSAGVMPPRACLPSTCAACRR
jgi:predicted 3-demethylubiquinone-9 3-methyltransferase (glyoxalase superfamily)